MFLTHIWLIMCFHIDILVLNCFGMLRQDTNEVHKGLKINVYDVWNIMDKENGLDILILII